jgi:hypothetical protein
VVIQLGCMRLSYQRGALLLRWSEIGGEVGGLHADARWLPVCSSVDWIPSLPPIQTVVLVGVLLLADLLDETLAEVVKVRTPFGHGAVVHDPYLRALLVLAQPRDQPCVVAARRDSSPSPRSALAHPAGIVYRRPTKRLTPAYWSPTPVI